MPAKRVWTDEQIKDIIILYRDNEYSITYIAKNIYHCRESFIKEILKNNNIKIQPQHSRKFNKDEIEQIIRLYTEEKWTQKELAEKFHCNAMTIHKILVDNNINIIRINPINRHINENYFERIDSEEKAYFLGFIFADGAVHKNQLAVEIHEKDREILIRLKQELGLESKISHRKRNNTELCKILCTSDKIVSDLSKYGIIPNKTEFTKHLPQIPNELLRHFLRGLIDGDGWITKDKKGYYHLGFVSQHKSICQEFQSYCNSLITKQSKSKIVYGKSPNGNYRCQFTGKELVKQLAIALYKDNNICLSRKYRLVEPLFDFKSDEDIV